MAADVAAEILERIKEQGKIESLMFIFQQRGGFYLFAGCVPRIDIDETRIIALVSRGFRRDECTCVIVGKDSRLSVFPSRTPSSCLSVSVLINHDNPCLSQTPERIRGTNWAKLITRSLGFASQRLRRLPARQEAISTRDVAPRNYSRFRKDGAREKASRNRGSQFARANENGTYAALHRRCIGAETGVETNVGGFVREGRVTRGRLCSLLSITLLCGFTAGRVSAPDDSPRYYPRARGRPRGRRG